MSHHQPGMLEQQHTPDDILTQRTLQDAHFLMNGAEFIDGQLHVTDAQIEYAKKQHESTAPKFGFMVLRDERQELESEIIDTPNEVLLTEEANRRSLRDDIDAVTEPYNQLFADRIPDKGKEPRSLIGVRKDKVKWRQKIDRGRIEELEHRFELEFKAGPHNNEITNMTLDVMFKNTSNLLMVEVAEPLLRLAVTYEYGKPKNIDVQAGLNSRVKQVLMDPDSNTGKLVDILGLSAPDRYRHDYIFELDDAAPELIVGMTTVHSTGCAYRYNPATDEFDLFGDAVDYSYNPPAGIGTSSTLTPMQRPMHLSRQQFLDGLEGALQILPVRPQ